MTRHVMLDNVTHAELRVITRYGAQFGDEVGTVLTFPTEYADVQREYPIFFRKDSTSGEYHSVALLGFGKNENLFLEQGRWLADYVPGMVVRGPFLIGFQERGAGGESRREPMIHVDLDHPRVSRTEGEPVFLPKGGNSPYLDHIALVLRGI
ncbi:MAG TPA: SapC family protein, partial [Steroidobacteraceae bacterium]|nr:SapC family protein [Steroidobacteraceae bacterium]